MIVINSTNVGDSSKKMGELLCEDDCHLGGNPVSCRAGSADFTSFRLMGLKAFLLAPLTSPGPERGLSSDGWPLDPWLLSAFCPGTASICRSEP